MYLEVTSSIIAKDAVPACTGKIQEYPINITGLHTGKEDDTAEFVRNTSNVRELPDNHTHAEQN